MKYISFASVLLMMVLSANISIKAQSEASLVSISFDVELSSTDYRNARNELLGFINRNNIKVKNQTETKSSMDVDFVISEAQYNELDAMLPRLGYVVSRHLNTLNHSQQYKEGELEIAYQQQKKDAYNEMLGKMDEKSDKYYELWRDIRTIDETIYTQKKQMLALENPSSDYDVTLRLTEENDTPSRGRVSFVNMPGIEYSYLNVENPLPSVSADNYQGYFIKYLFTRGKSFAKVGAFKASNTSAADSTQFSEMFLFGFGQDFYTRHLGMGERHFLNLYTGYTVGGLIATSDADKKTIFYIDPSVGLELFKNKYILIDTKVSYFIPFNYNSNLRGVSYSASFNFVF